MSYAADCYLINCIREALGKDPLPPEPDLGTLVSLDGIREMTRAEWAKAHDCSRQAVSRRLRDIQRRLERGDPNPYRYNPALGNGARRRLRKRKHAPARICP